MLEIGFQLWFVTTICVWALYFTWIMRSTQINGIPTVPPESMADIPRMALALALIWPLTIKPMMDMYGD